MSQQKKSAKHKTHAKRLLCQSCSHPLRRKSFKSIEDEILDELCSSNYINTADAEKDDRNILLPIFNKKLESSVMKKVVFPIRIPDITLDFMVVGELNSLPLDNMESLKVTSALHSLMSENESIDHPVCVLCTDNILDEMDSQLKSSKDEYKLYMKFLDEIEDDNEDDPEELQSELNDLNAKVAVLENSLNDLIVEAEKTEKCRKDHEEEHAILELKSKVQSLERNRLKHQLLSLDDSEHSTNKQISHANDHLQKLKNTNVFNTTFHIWYSGHFGTINNYRLGRLPKVPVEWTEINAAWGQTVLLLHCLAKKVNLTFDRYKLAPCGNHSYIVSMDNGIKELPLYCLGGVRYVLDHKFDHAMIAFLDCLQQLKEKVECEDGSFRLPYKMDKGKIEDSSGKSYSVKIYMNSQEEWTKAMKLMLTNLKWILKWASS